MLEKSTKAYFGCKRFLTLWWVDVLVLENSSFLLLVAHKCFISYSWSCDYRRNGWESYCWYDWQRNCLHRPDRCDDRHTKSTNIWKNWVSIFAIVKSHQLHHNTNYVQIHWGLKKSRNEILINTQGWLHAAEVSYQNIVLKRPQSRASWRLACLDQLCWGDLPPPPTTKDVKTG